MEIKNGGTVSDGYLRASEEMLKQVNGEGRLDGEGERQKEAAAGDEGLVAMASEVRLRSAPPLIAGIWKQVAAQNDAILSLSFSLKDDSLYLLHSTWSYSLYSIWTEGA